MNKLNNLDELQLIKRGNIFKHGLYTLAGLLLANALLYSIGVQWAPGKWAELTFLLITVVLCSIEFIYYEIFPMTEKRQKYAIYFLGLFGLGAIVACTLELVQGKTGIIAEGKIVSSALGILYGLLFFSVFVTFILKKQYKSKHENDEED